MAEQSSSDSSDTMELDSDTGDENESTTQSEDEEGNGTISVDDDTSSSSSSVEQESSTNFQGEGSSGIGRGVVSTRNPNIQIIDLERNSSTSDEEEENDRTQSNQGEERNINPSNVEEGNESPGIQEESIRSSSNQEGGVRIPVNQEERDRSPIIQGGPGSENQVSPELRRRQRRRTRRRSRRQTHDSHEDGEHADNLEAAAAREEPQAPQESQPQASGASLPPPPNVEQTPNLPQQQQQQEEPTRPVVSEEGNASTSHTQGVGLPAEGANRPPAEAGPSSYTTPPQAGSGNPSKDVPAAHVTSDSEDEGQSCTICFEPVANMGEHHLACLKCGHMFGYKCIVKWLGEAYRQKGRCPQCNSLASKKDVRKLYAKNIKVVDTTEKERLKKDLEKEKEERWKKEVECENIKLKYKLKTEKLTEVLKELEVLKAAVNKANIVHPGEASTSRNRSKQRLVFNQFMDISHKGECRVMAYNEWLAMLVVSVKSQVEMFPGYGIKKINMLELRTDCYVPLHQQLIRDLTFNPSRHDVLLSVAVDRYIKITNIQSNALMGHFVAAAPIWCCCWNTRDTNVFYIGTATGNLVQYDIRRTDGPVGIVDLPGKGPVVSLAYIHPGPESSFSRQGLLVARLQQCAFVEEWLTKKHTLSTEGNLVSLCCVPDSCHVLASFRPSPQFPHIRHTVCTLDQREGSSGQEVFFNPLHTFHGGTKQGTLNRSLLTRSSHNRSSLLVCAGDEASQSLIVWDVATMTCLQQLQCPAVVMDMLLLHVGQKEYLAVLTVKGVRLYDWTVPSS